MLCLFSAGPECRYLVNAFNKVSHFGNTNRLEIEFESKFEIISFLFSNVVNGNSSSDFFASIFPLF